MRIIDPVVLDPLRKEWVEAYADASKAEGDKQRKIIVAFLDRLRAVRVLDPACGSGNFLYLALRGLKDLEHLVLIEAWQLGHKLGDPQIGPEAVLGIELSPYAAELARVSVWIGHLQWQLEHGYDIDKNPVLKSLETIENKDALVVSGNEEAAWPYAEYIVGNPPFLGNKLMRGELGDEYTEGLRRVFRDRVSGEVDLCAYWFEKCRSQIELGHSRRAGLIATQAIRGGANRLVLDKIKSTGSIFEAWGDVDWVLDGANVHVSIIGFDDGSQNERRLNGQSISSISSNLAVGSDITKARPVLQSTSAFIGISMHGPFEVSEADALRWISEPNPNGRPSSDVLRPIVNARELAGINEARWLPLFDPQMSEQEITFFESPYSFVESIVRPVREENRREAYRKRWWLPGEFRPAMLAATKGVARILVTPRVSKHRLWRWYSSHFVPSDACVCVPVEDDFYMGVLHSRLHEIWSLSQGTQLREKESGFRYTPTTCFETFPFPNPTGAQCEAISAAARELNDLRESWLNPPEWTQQETLIFPATVGGPWHRWIPNTDSLEPGTVAEAHYIRTVPKLAAKKMVAERTLTALYNKKPAWLRNAHEKLDKAVAEAYNLPWDIPEQDLLAALLKLNLEQANQTP